MTVLDPALLAQLPLFMAAVLVLNVTPGVDVLLTVTRTARGGARAGIVAASGIAAGCAVHALAVAFGLGALLAWSAGAFTLLKWAGAAYLVWLGCCSCWPSCRSSCPRSWRTRRRPCCCWARCSCCKAWCFCWPSSG